MPNILLVEDSATQAMQMKILLESAAHHVECCDDGTQALESLASGKNEIVVTDMELPVMNGLELIRNMQANFPHIPAVLVTGRGSEKLAAEALRTGATAYVPKALLNEMLLGTIEDVLGVLRTDQSYAKLIDCTVENRLVFELPNDPRLATDAVNLTMQMIAGMKLLSGGENYRVGTAMQHAIFNAIFRGNLELTFAQWQQKSVEENVDEAHIPIVAERMQSAPYANRKIHFDARLLRDVIRVVIRDEGRGFDTARYMDENDTHALAGKHGRGLLLIRNFMDKVSFNGPGNEITLIKYCQ